MKLELFRDPICIGQLSSDEILRLVGFLKGDKFVINLEGKSILDFGAGFSDLSSKLIANTNVQEVTALDKIYRDEHTISEVIRETLNYLRRIQRIFGDINLESSKEGLLDISYTMNSITDRVKTVLAFEEAILKNDTIKKYSSLSEIKDNSTDYIFINFLFSYVKDKEILLRALYEKLKKGGEIIITDFVRGSGMLEFVESSLFNTNMEIKVSERDVYKGAIIIRK